MLWVLIFAIFGIIISVWNAYASGYNSVALKSYQGKFSDFFNLVNSFSLVLAFAGATYYTALILGVILLYLSYISTTTLQALYSLNFLVFGGLIAFTGIVVTISSIINAYYSRDWRSILVSIWNVFASLWNSFIYLTNFLSALRIWEGAEERDRSKALVILAIAALIGIFITYFAYKFGKERAWQIFGRF